MPKQNKKQPTSDRFLRDRKCEGCDLRAFYLKTVGIDHKWDTGCKFLCTNRDNERK